jgi:hypothetical protein
MSQKSTETDPSASFVEDSELLKLILILCNICIKQDRFLLSRYVYVVSRNLENDEFDRVLRKSMKILESYKNGEISCQDWLINELFSIYKMGE